MGVRPTDYACSTCAAKVGEPCTTQAGKATSPHKNRGALASKARHQAWLDRKAAERDVDSTLEDALQAWLDAQPYRVTDSTRLRVEDLLGQLQQRPRY